MDANLDGFFATSLSSLYSIKCIYICACLTRSIVWMAGEITWKEIPSLFSEGYWVQQEF